MSREYFLMAHFENVSRNKVWNFFISWCGFSQILKIDWDAFHKSGSVQCIMGCSSGVRPEDTVDELKKQLEEIGAKDIEIMAWSLHPDKCECSI